MLNSQNNNPSTSKDPPGLGIGIMTTYPQIANIAGIHGLLVYTSSSCLPILAFAFFAPIIRKKCPESFVLTEWCFQRFGKPCGYYLSLCTIFTMFLYMISELTAIHDAIEALTGLDAMPCVIVQAIITTIYTAIGGFNVSFKTDVIQTLFVLVVFVIAIIAYATEIHIDPVIKKETYHFMTGANKLGWMLFYLLNMAIVTNYMFLSNFWLRAFAAKTDHDLVVGCSIATLALWIIITICGLPGILAVWTGDLPIGSDEGYNAFYILCAKMDKWVIGVILLYACVVSTTCFDTMLSGMTSSISNDIFRNKINIIWIRLIVAIVMVPALIIAIKCSANVLQVFLIADLLSSAVIPILFLGLWDRLWFLDGIDIILGGLGGLLSVFIYGCIYYGTALEGAKLLLIENGMYDENDWGAFGAFVCAPLFGVIVGFASAGARIGVLYLISKKTGKPFTALDKLDPKQNSSEVSVEDEITYQTDINLVHEDEGVDGIKSGQFYPE
ncbi:unnamed protein product [Ambrosiozyma monospora]|uniref:Unnamed protein product n=1 Tax=Ambrosiozyma monospora TaxID=43982 RepID=A0A9W7DFP1_AMBMO|nr:unnamed protein product [Ambrosiozyma monospora]